MKLLLFTDAWFPQVNGVVRTLNMVTQALRQSGDDVDIISPADFTTMPCPTYPEIRLAIGAGRAIKRRLKHQDYDAVHIATEGPIGYAARGICKRQGIHFTTAYHTKFP
ncbi:MAG: glycosyltransferase, partial [Pseudomonadota bacterium]